MEILDFKKITEQIINGDYVLPVHPIKTAQEIAEDEQSHFEARLEFWSRPFLKTLPAEWADRNLSMLPESDIKALLSSYSPNDDDFGFLLIGRSGVGKTFILNALMNKLIKIVFESKLSLPEYVAYYPIGYLIYQLRTKRDAPEFNDCISKYFLFLDDLGSENTTDFAREHFFTILDLRCQKKLPTFISTNLSLNELTQKYGERVTSRLKEMCVILELKGNDKRSDIMRDRIGTLKQRITNLTP